MSDSVWPHRWQPTRLPRPWDSPGKNIVAISFSSAWKWKVKVKSLSHIRLFANPWTAAYQAPPSMGFSRQEYWSGVPLPSPDFWLLDIINNSELRWLYYYNVPFYLHRSWKKLKILLLLKTCYFLVSLKMSFLEKKITIHLWQTKN